MSFSEQNAKLHYLTCLPLLLLLIPVSWKRILIYGVLYIIFCKIIYPKETIRPRLNDIVTAVPISAVLGYSFFQRWLSSAYLSKASDLLKIQPSILLYAAAFLLGALSVFETARLIAWVHYNHQAAQTALKNRQLKSQITFSEILIILFISVLTMLICTKSSPLYPFNDWVDSNAYFSVGKGILRGMVPYRDLFEHKGPLLYFLHAAAALISYDSFFGMFIIETVCCFFFLLYSYRILQFWFGSNSLTAIPLMAGLVYSSTAFSHGDSVEELCFPLLAYGIYVSLKSIRKQKIPAYGECFAIGVTSACVLWMKYSILGFYFGWILVPVFLCIKQKDSGSLFSMIGMITLGVLAASLPILLYFGLNGALADLWEVYFYDNIFLYGSTGAESAGLIDNFYHGFLRIIIYNLPAILLFFFGAIWCFTTESKLTAIHYVLLFTGMVFVIYSGTRRYGYYSLIFGVFAPVGTAFLHCSAVSNISYRTQMTRLFTSLIVSVMIIFVCSPNIYMLKYHKENLPQFQVSEIIRQSEIENPTLLNYGFLDGGFYTAAGIVPSQKYFYTPNLPLDEISEQQTDYTENGLTDFIVTRGKPKEFALYDYIDSFSYYYEGTERTYSLYMLKRHKKD